MKLKTHIIESNYNKTILTQIKDSHDTLKFKVASFGLEVGWGNGYVLLPKDHIFYGIHYDEINQHIHVHGGLTFSSLVDEDLKNNFGLEDSDIGSWIIGFDTAHYRDNLTTWPKERVQRETEALRRRLEDLQSLTQIQSPNKKELDGPFNV